MSYHKSVNKYYHKLCNKNPTLKDFSRVTSEENWPSIFDEMNFDKSMYAYSRSLLFQGFTEPSINYSSGLPTSLTKYRVVFGVGVNKNYNVPSMAVYYDFINRCNFYEEFFLRLPDSVRIKNCKDGDACFLRIGETGLWCEDCYGTFEKVNNLQYLLHESIDFRVVPKQSIYFIEKITTPIDMQDIESLAGVRAILEANLTKLAEECRKICEKEAVVKKRLDELDQQIKALE